MPKKASNRSGFVYDQEPIIQFIENEGGAIELTKLKDKLDSLGPRSRNSYFELAQRCFVKDRQTGMLTLVPQSGTIAYAKKHQHTHLLDALRKAQVRVFVEHHQCLNFRERKFKRDLL